MSVAQPYVGGKQAIVATDPLMVLQTRPTDDLSIPPGPNQRCVPREYSHHALQLMPSAETGLLRALSFLETALPAALAVAGFVSSVALVHWAGPRRIFYGLSTAGWLLLPVALLHAVPIVLDAAAWRVLTPSPRPALVTFAAARWVREGVNALLPVAQIGGEIVAIRFLSRFGASTSKAVAVVTLDLMTEFLSMALVGMIGAVLLYELSSVDQRSSAALIVWPMIPPTLIAAGLLVALRTRFFGWLAGRLSHCRPGLSAWFDEAQQTFTMASSRPRCVAGAVAVHCLGWLARATETWVMLRAIGHPLRASDAFALETTSEVFRSFGFAFPGLLGVQEGSLALVGGLLGLPAAAAIALALFRRIRDVVLGIPSLIVWQLFDQASRRQRSEPPLRASFRDDGAGR